MGRALNTNRLRLIIFAGVALLHVVLILFFAITVDAVALTPEPPEIVMKITDLREETPPPAPPPPPEPADIPPNAVETIAETMIETDEVPENQVLVDPGTLIVSRAPEQYSQQEDYLPMHKISVAPRFDEKKLLDALIYPPIALRSGLEGTVYLELWINSKGEVQQAIILREEPEGRGFGEAAVKAFMGMKGTPAQANGAAVATRYRYPVRFTLKG